MKKKVKALVVAASVAAIAGIGAVSFAAWSGSTDTNKTITGATGEIDTIGAITVTPSTTSGSVDASGAITMNALVPYDQGSGVTYWEFDLSSDTTGEQTVKYTILGSIAKGSGTGAQDIGDAELRWSTTAPTTDTDGAEVSSTAADITGTTVYVFLVASGTDAMNANISLTFAVADAA